MNSSKFRSVLIVMFMVSALFALSLTPAYGATTGNDGLDRWVNLEVSEDPAVDADSNYTTTANITVEETIAVNHTFSGTLTQEVYGNTTYTNNWINVTIANATWTNTFTSGAISRSTNGSVAFTVDTNVPRGWYNATVTLENNRSQSDSQANLDTNVTSNTAFSMLETTYMIGQLIPIIVLIAVVIPLIFGAIKGIGDDLED